MTDKSKLLPVIFEALGYFITRKHRYDGSRHWWHADCEGRYESRPLANALVKDGDDPWSELLASPDSQLPDPFENLSVAWGLIPIIQGQCDTFGLLFSDEAIGIWGNIASDSFEVFSKDTSSQAVADAICLAFGETVKTLDN